MNQSRKIVLAAALLLYAAWLVRHLGLIVADDTGLILCCLANLFAVIILLRRKDPDAQVHEMQGRRAASLGVAGAVAALIGLIAPVRQLEWLGLLAMLYACLRWALPSRHERDLRWALLLLYWANPLPTAVIGRVQLLLQWLSVAGSEWFLHAMNVRMWADGFVLRAGYGTFAVPDACSGLRAASTVFVSVLGVSVLLRFRWWEALSFLLLGLAQVVALNIVRISFMVKWAPRMPPEWSQNFLHDTLGIFLLIAVFLIQAEASWWKAWRTRRRVRREGILRGDFDGPERATILPAAWRHLVKWWLPAAAVVLVVLGVAFAVYKHRPAHRAAMISDIVDVLAESDPEVAGRAVDAALKLTPDDAGLTEKKGILLARRGKYAEALDVLGRLESPSLTASIMKSWALMAMKRPDEAAAVVAALPPSAQELPGVAMVKAEFAATRGDPVATAAELRKVGRLLPLQPRVRALFPYLAAHEQWDTIVATDAHGPYPDATTALIGLHACIRVNDMAAAGGVMRRAVERWPEDVRFLGHYFLLALDRPGGEWEGPLERNLVLNLRLLQVDALATHLADAFKLGRPDLAWMVFRRLQEIDPRDPSLDLALAEFGPAWLAFRKHDIALQDRDPTARIDLLPMYRWSHGIKAFQGFWRHVPAVEEIAKGDVRTLRRKHTDAGLTELLRRESAGELTERLEFMLPGVLASAGRYPEAHERLDALAKRYPDRRAQIVLQGAFLRHAQGKWQEAYEQLLTYESLVPLGDLRVAMLKVNTLMNLGLGVYALDEIAALRSRFPESLNLDRAESAIWDVFGFKEDALFILNRAGLDLRSVAAVQLLYDTGRIRLAEQMTSVHGVRIESVRPTTVQPYVLPAAELSIARRWEKPLSDQALDLEAVQHEEKAKGAFSPFVRDLEQLEAQWRRARGANETSNPDRWVAVGRTPQERAAALKQLVMLLARQERSEEALRVCRRAIELTPHSVILRRMLLALTQGAPADVAEARARFPLDPEIWLADLVVRTRDNPTNDWVKAVVSEADTIGRFSPGTLVRAGDFLLRKGQPKPASVLARAAIRRGQGLLAADVLGLSCALIQRDLPWAVECALGGIEHAVDEVPFYKALVLIKSDEEAPDADMVRALEYLREHAPKEGRWSERLAQTYFERGDARRAMAIFSEVLSDDFKGARVQSLLMASEAARLQGDTSNAISILDSAHALYPDRVSILNNLVYSLAQNPATVPRATKLLPRLLELSGESFAVLDTAATVHLKAGDIKTADQYMQKALKSLNSKDYGAAETRLSAAEIDYRMGRFDDARSQLKIIQSAPELSSSVESGVRDLLLKLNSGR
jgi:exosortase/archaeosortase family protein